MSPLPHPHTPGNMWLARCDYVAKLVRHIVGQGQALFAFSIAFYFPICNVLAPKRLIHSLPKTGSYPVSFLEVCRCHLVLSHYDILNPNTRVSINFVRRFGHGRYFYEHWVHSHPSVEPCDLSTDNFVWNYNGVPSVPFGELWLCVRSSVNVLMVSYCDDTHFRVHIFFCFPPAKDIQPAPRFDFKKYVKNVGGCSMRPFDVLQRQIHGYQNIYNTTAGEDWWGWGFFNNSYTSN
eukprot:scaffold13555_cov109-Alexandrium_tamarense.AAC.1